jgi:inner membrane protein
MKLAWKVMAVALMTLAILVPLAMIRGVVHDRQAYRLQAVEAIARSESGAQGIAGPVLVVPWTEVVEVEEKDARGEVLRVVRRDGASGEWVFFAQDATFTARLAPYTRRLGLHEVRMYALAGTLQARFEVQVPADPDPALPRRIGQPWLGYGIADVRGLRAAPRLRLDGRETLLQQGQGHRGQPGVHARLPAPQAGTPLAFDAVLQIELSGAEAFAFAPLARRNQVAVESAWPHPRFNGAFLPRERSIGASGFRGEWEVSALATNAQAQYLAGQGLSSADVAAVRDGGASALDVVGISLVDPVNPYSQADRATKYGVLFVLLTFVGFFMLELVRQLRIHPVQYALAGLALAIFFLLLVALSEHVAFGWAYLAASAACIGLLGFYLAHVLRSAVRGAGFAAMLALLYAALYGLLVSEDNALVLGAGLLFAILAALMVATRRVDWYQVASAPQRAA